MIRCVYFLLTLSSPSSSLSSSLSQITPHRCCQRGALYSGQSFPCTPLGFSCFTKFDHASISRRLCSPSSPRPPSLVEAINHAPKCWKITGLHNSCERFGSMDGWINLRKHIKFVRSDYTCSSAQPLQGLAKHKGQFRPISSIVVPGQ